MTATTPSTTHQSGTTPLDAIKEIDQELSQISESARALRSRRNDLAPVSALPPELLSTIFIYTVTPDLSWVVVSHICRHWRAVALGSARLWSTILLYRPRWAKEMLNRSKLAPIDIEGDLSFITPRLLSALHTALEHKYRTRSLRITAFHPALVSVAAALNGGVPLLHSLSLRNSLHNGYALDAGLTIPSTMKAPQLRRLELHKCSIEWNSPYLQHLTYFKLHDAARPTMFELVTALRSMPNLETLDLRDSLPSPATVDGFNAATVRLDKLTNISLKDSLVSCAGLLNCISYPHPASVELDCTFVEGDDRALFGCLKLLRQISARSVISLELAQVGPSCVNAVISDSTCLSDKPVRLSLDVWWAPEIGVSAADVLLHICKMLKLAHLKMFRYHQIDEPDGSLWAEHLSTLPKLRNVSVSGVPVHSFIEALQISQRRRSPSLSASGNGRSSLATSFPALHKVSLQKGDFTRNANGNVLLTRLHNALGRRAEQGMPVTGLAFEWCMGLSAADITTFRAVVQDVSWDGMESVLNIDDDDEGSLYDAD